MYKSNIKQREKTFIAIQWRSFIIEETFLLKTPAFGLNQIFRLLVVLWPDCSAFFFFFFFEFVVHAKFKATLEQSL